MTLLPTVQKAPLRGPHRKTTQRSVITEGQDTLSFRIDGTSSSRTESLTRQHTAGRRNSATFYVDAALLKRNPSGDINRRKSDEKKFPSPKRKSDTKAGTWRTHLGVGAFV